MHECGMQDCRMQDAGLQDAGLRECGMQDCRMPDAGCRMQISPQSSLPANQPACKSGRHLRNKSSLSCQARLGFHCCPNLRKLAFFATDYRWWAVSAIRTCNRASEHCPCHQTATSWPKEAVRGCSCGRSISDQCECKETRRRSVCVKLQPQGSYVMTLPDTSNLWCRIRDHDAGKNTGSSSKKATTMAVIEIVTCVHAYTCFAYACMQRVQLAARRPSHRA